MGRKKSLFSGGSRSISTQTTNSNSQPHPPELDHLKESLEKKVADREMLPAVNLKGAFPARDRGKEITFYYDLTDLAAKFPRYERIINQLVAGVSYARRGTSHKNLDGLFKSIYEFIEFLNGNHNLSNTAVSLVADITVTVCSSYRTYLTSRFPGRTVNSQRYGALRQIVTSLQVEFTSDPSVGPLIHWPIGPRVTSKPRQGYTPREMGELITFCQRDITETKRLHSMYAAAQTGERILSTEWNLPNLMSYLVEKRFKPREVTIAAFIWEIISPSPNAKRFLAQKGYTVKDISLLYKSQGEALARNGHYPSKRPEDWTLENFMFWVKYRWENSPQRYVPVNEIIKKYIRSVPDALRFLDLNGYSPDYIADLYFAHGEELASAGRNPFGHKFDRANKGNDERNFKLILATLAQEFPGYPFGMRLDEATNFFNQNRFVEMKGDVKRSVEGRLLRAISVTKTKFVHGGTIGCINLIRAAMHFLPETLYPFLLHVQINTGWNLESVLALTDDVDAHVTDDLIDPENYVVIQSTKRRSQDNGGKAVFHRCSRHKQFSTYRLLKYVESIVTKYKGCQSYKTGRLWQHAVRSSAAMTQLISYCGESTSDLHYASKFSLRRHSFTYFNEGSINHGRIRTSYETLREQQGLPLAVISQDMDHADQETTVVHYASDKTSNAVKDVKIAEYQEQIIEDLRHYECRAVESLSLAKLRDAIRQSRSEAERKKQLQKAAKAIGLDERGILHLISPEGQTYIVACRDSLNPTWASHEEYLKPGQHCSFFNKCGGCRQAVIFPEALPYIARRQLDLEQLRKELNTFEWMSDYGEEWDAWDGVLNDWSDREQVDAARRAAILGEVILPLRLRGAR
jgi:hypothetical protein